ITHLPLAAAAFGSRLYVFGTGTDNRIYINSAREDQPFGGWQEVQGDGITHDAVAAAAFGTRLYVIGKGVAVPAHV
ncbi:hypothetical protein, partial [Nonomuraea thailandensis]